MNKRQINVLHMFKSVNTCLDDNTDTWNGIGPIVDAKNELQTRIDVIEIKGQQQQEKGSTGYTADKQNKMDAVVEETYSLCLKIRPYAKKTKNEVLLVVVDHSKKSLEDGADIDILNRSRTISEKAKEYKNELADYRVMDDDIAGLDNAINEASPLTAKRDNVQGQRSQITSSLVELFSAGQETVDILDDLIEGILTKTNSEFVTTYQNTRKVIDRAGRHAKVESSKTVVLDEKSKKDVL